MKYGISVGGLSLTYFTRQSRLGQLLIILNKPRQNLKFFEDNLLQISASKKVRYYNKPLENFEKKVRSYNQPLRTLQKKRKVL